MTGKTGEIYRVPGSLGIFLFCLVVHPLFPCSDDDNHHLLLSLWVWKRVRVKSEGEEEEEEEARAWRKSAIQRHSIRPPICPSRMKEAKGKKGGVAPVEAKDKKANDKKRSLSVKESKPKKRQARTEAKAKKDPNQPKRPPTAFFIFLEEFRKSFKEKHPDVKGVTAVGKACGEKWKQMSEEEKAPYNAKAVQKRAEYDKTLTAYKKKQGSQEEGGTPEESEKSKSEINDEDDDDEESGDDGDED